MPTKYILDANVLIRFLRGDDAVQSPAAKELFSQAQQGDCALVLTDLCVAETVWILTSFYRQDRQTVAKVLLQVLGQPGLECPQQTVLRDALRRFQTGKADFIDCYFAAYGASTGLAVASFDRDFKQFKDVDWLEPKHTRRT